MVLPRFVRAALRGDPITVYGDGLQTRTFAHVADIVPALLALMGRLLEAPASISGQVVNLGSPHPVTIRALAERVRDRVGAAVEIQHLDPAQAMPPGFDEIRARVPDTTHAQAFIGFRCRYDLDAIIDDVIAHLRPCAHTPTTTR
jgi:UDP-glucose 4-epimerase